MSVSAGTLIRGGFVMSMVEDEREPVVSDVLIRDGLIAEVGASIDAPGAEVIDARGQLVMPGMVDSHLHLWQTPLRGMTADLWAREYFHTVHPMSEHYTPEDMYWATYAGGLELLSHGVTRVFDYCHSVNSPEHADASIRGLRDAGIRATYGVGLFERDGATYVDRAQRLEDLARLAAAVADDELVDVALALDHAYDGQAVATARELGIGISVHGNPVGLLQEFADAEALGPDVLWVHGNFSSDAEIEALATSGAFLSLSPDIEMGMGKPVAIFDRAARAGIPITLSVDVVSYTAADMLTQMHLTYALHRVLDGDKERSRGHVPPHRAADTPLVSTRDVVRSGTVTGSRALSRDTEVTGIAAGAPADLVLVDTEPFGLSMGDPAGHVVLQTTSRDINTVVVAGQVKYRRGELIGIDTREVSAELGQTRERLLKARDNGLTTH